MVVDGAAGGVRADHRSASDPREDLGERGRRRVGEIEDHAELDEPVDERAPEAGEPAVLGGAVGVRVAAVPGEPRHAHAELPERLGGPELVRRTARRPRARASARSARPARPRRDRRQSRTWSDPVAVLAHGTEEARRLTERLAQRSLGWRSSSTKTGQTCSPTPPASSSGSHVRANAPVSPKRSSRWPSSSSRSTWASAITLLESTRLPREFRFLAKARNRGIAEGGLPGSSQAAERETADLDATPGLDIRRRGLSLYDGHTKSAAGLTTSLPTSPRPGTRA